MGSDSGFVRSCLPATAGVLLLSASTFGAGLLFGNAGTASRLLWLGCGFAAAGAVALLWLGLRALARRSDQQPLERYIDVPRGAVPEEQLHAIEILLEHAPVALCIFDQTIAAEAARPLNASARRLLVRGYLSDTADLFGKLGRMPIGRHGLVEFDTDGGIERVLASAMSLAVGGRPHTLVALMQVESELEEEAAQAWEKLVHVLTHEIMNSLTPVASLSQTLRTMVERSSSTLPAATATSLDTALDAIGRRAESLAQFVGTYRELANVPAPVRQKLNVAQMLERLSALVTPEWESRGGKTVFAADSASLELMVDAGQLEQALLNLLKNAAEATEDVAQPSLSVSARLTRAGGLRIEVADNGPGVPDGLAAQIFLPFYSTKERGNGIGLAMARQLVSRNGGKIRYLKSIGPGARFIVSF